MFFRKLKKLYFKFYHLLRFLGVFIFIFLFNIYNVNALEYSGEIASCWDSEIKPLIGLQDKKAYYKVSSDSWVNTPMNSVFTLSTLFPVEVDKTYYLRFLEYNRSDAIYWFTLYDSDKKPLTDTYFFNSLNFSSYANYTYSDGLITFTLTKPSNVAYVSFVFYPFTNKPPSTFRYIFSEFDLTDLSVCPNVPPPPYDGPIVSYISIFTSQFSKLAEFFTTNQYAFTFIVIIFGWVVIELFLKLFNIRK